MITFSSMQRVMTASLGQCEPRVVPCVSLMKCRLKVIITCDLIPNSSFKMLFRAGYELQIGREVVGEQQGNPLVDG